MNDVKGERHAKCMNIHTFYQYSFGMREVIREKGGRHNGCGE